MFRRMLLITSTLIGTALSCQDTCLPGFCNQDNYCEKCQDGYYIVPVEAGFEYGQCAVYPQGCTTCLSPDRCTTCESGYTQNVESCPQCSPNCKECQNFPDECTACPEGFALDANNSCYFRYTLVIFIGATVSVIFAMIIFRLISKCMAKRGIVKLENVLDEEAKKNVFYVNHAKKIGRTEDENHDLSAVVSSDGPLNESFITRKTAEDDDIRSIVSDIVSSGRPSTQTLNRSTAN